jgi:hypothetical protein
MQGYEKAECLIASIAPAPADDGRRPHRPARGLDSVPDSGATPPTQSGLPPAGSQSPTVQGPESGGRTQVGAPASRTDIRNADSRRVLEDDAMHAIIDALSQRFSEKRITVRPSALSGWVLRRLSAFWVMVRAHPSIVRESPVARRFRRGSFRTDR